MIATKHLPQIPQKLKQIATVPNLLQFDFSDDETSTHDLNQLLLDRRNQRKNASQQDIFSDMMNCMQ
ncbi:hypothetical protein SS50377_28027 [Spironucleus salmonicida]|uniref:Uncharacterized protein n=1 Tax=Spironucleus salmonicida TaxID=348837 RepID=A0A9P8LL46_9EUKA|nr:hypothetical protein SS50377_28027 [Spironucleus salmonicida]